jgi:MFS transporter, FHS family, L-fucose permease
MGWRGIFPVFFVLMAAAFVSVLMVRVEEAPSDIPPSIGSSLRLLKEPVFLLAVLGIFLYVGAESCMGRFLTPGLKAMGIKDSTAGELGPPLFFLLMTIGRIGGGAILTVIKPRPFFRISALLGMLGTGAMMTGIPGVAIPGVFAAGLGFANIYPLLFSISVEERPERANELSGLMCMAISGGAIVPLVMGQLVDLGLNAGAFVVPVACLAYLLVLSLRSGHASTPT